MSRITRRSTVLTKKKLRVIAVIDAEIDAARKAEQRERQRRSRANRRAQAE